LDSLSDIEPIADFEGAPQAKPKVAHVDLVLKQTPPLPATDSPQFSEAIKTKLSICATECFWDDPDADCTAKKVKTLTMNEIHDLIKPGCGLSSQQITDIVTVIEGPIFRAVPEPRAVFMRSDDLVPMTEPSWPHLSLNYQIMNAIILAFPEYPRFGGMPYIQSLIERFRCPDLNERSSLAYLLVAIQNSRPTLRAQILKLALDATIGYLDGQKSPFVVAPALTIVSQNFSDKPPTPEDPGDLPLYFRYILPLFGGLHYVGYQTQMSQIVDLMLKSVPLQTATPTMKAIMLRFPLTRSSKTIEFLRLLTIVLGKVPQRDIRAHMKPIFLLFARCAAMGQVKVTAAACPVWNKIELEPLIMDNAKFIFGLVYPILTAAQRDAWSQDISLKIEDVFRIFARIDSGVFQDLCRGRAPLPIDSSQDQLKTWAGIARTASKVDPQLNLSAKLFEIQKHFSAGQTAQSFKTAVAMVPKAVIKLPSEPEVQRKAKPVLRFPG
jgi:hypothetical protein